MRGRPWYKRFPADFIAGTLSLSLEEKGAYAIVLDLIYDRGGPIPDDARWIARVCGCSTRKWAALRRRLIEAGKLIESDGMLSNPRAEAMLESAVREAAKLAENAAKSHRARRHSARDAHDSRDLDDFGQAHRTPDPNADSRVETPESTWPLSAADEAGPVTNRLTVTGERVLAAIGVADDPRWLGSYSRVQRWMADGCDPDLDILPTIERLMARRGHDPPRSLAYFDQAIADAKARRLKPMPEATPDARPEPTRPDSPHDRLLTGFAQAADRLRSEPARGPLRRPTSSEMDAAEED